jgi:hypothetical protein
MEGCRVVQNWQPFQRLHRSYRGARRSKRRASESDVEVARQAERIKALRNEGNLDLTSASISFDNVPFGDNLENPGIMVGVDANSAIVELRKSFKAETGGSVTKDKKIEVLDVEEKQLADEEKIDRLLLQNICGEILDEVMDFGGDDFVIPTNHITKNRSHKKGGR